MNDMKVVAIQYASPYLFVMASDKNHDFSHKDFIKSFRFNENDELVLLSTYQLDAELGEENKTNAFNGMFLNGSHLIAGYGAGLKSFRIMEDGSLSLLKTTNWRNSKFKNMGIGFRNDNCLVFSGGPSGKILVWPYTQDATHSGEVYQYNESIDFNSIISQDGENFYVNLADTTSLTHFKINQACEITKLNSVNYSEFTSFGYFYDGKLYDSKFKHYSEINEDGSLLGPYQSNGRVMYDVAEIMPEFLNSSVIIDKGFRLWIKNTRENQFQQIYIQ